MATASKTKSARSRAAAPAAKRAAAKQRATAVKKPRVAQPAKETPAAKVKKAKLVRHSYSLPKTEYDLLQSMKDRAARAGHPAKKGELLRAGIAVLAAMPDLGLVAALAAVPSRKARRARG